MNDHQIITAIKEGNKERDKALKFLFLNEPLRNNVFGTLHKMGAPQQDRADIFQDALITFDRNVIEHKFKEGSSISTYIVAISKYGWLNLKKKTSKIDYALEGQINIEIADEQTPETLYFQSEGMKLDANIKKILQELLSRLDEGCQQALRMWSEGQTMEKIKKKLGYKEEQGANNKTYRCRKRLKKLIQNDPTLLAFLKSNI